MTDLSIGAQIRHYREARGWSLKTLTLWLNHSGANVNREWVRKKEAGVTTVSVVQLLQFAAALGVSPIALLGNDDDEIVIAESKSGTALSCTHGELRRWFAGEIEDIWPGDRRQILEKTDA